MNSTTNKPKNPKKPWLAVFLNLVFFVGYLYVGNIWRFVIFLLIYLFIIPAVELTWGSQIRTDAFGVMVLISMFDVYNLTKKYNEKLSKNLTDNQKAG
jgi:hypothetical protein